MILKKHVTKKSIAISYIRMVSLWLAGACFATFMTFHMAGQSMDVKIQSLIDQDAQHSTAITQLQNDMKEHLAKENALENKISIIEGMGMGFGGLFGALQLLQFTMSRKSKLQDVDDLA